MQNVNDSPNTGRLEVVHGSMFAGKTEYTISRLRQEVSNHRRVMAFKHIIDSRYEPDALVTHRLDRFDAVRVPDAETLEAMCDGADVVAIDEGHFFGTDLIPVVRNLRDRGLTVLVAGITYDVWGRPFDPMPQLIEFADHVELCRAPCRVCGEPAPYNQRTTAMDSLHMVGGLNDYEPRCEKHFTPLAGEPEN
jgi:thymidine kinase